MVPGSTESDETWAGMERQRQPCSGGLVWYVSCCGLAFAQDLWELSQLLCTYQGYRSAKCLQWLPLEACPHPCPFLSSHLFFHQGLSHPSIRLCASLPFLLALFGHPIFAPEVLSLWL